MLVIGRPAFRARVVAFISRSSQPRELTGLAPGQGQPCDQAAVAVHRERRQVCRHPFRQWRPGDLATDGLQGQLAPEPGLTRNTALGRRCQSRTRMPGGQHHQLSSGQLMTRLPQHLPDAVTAHQALG